MDGAFFQDPPRLANTFDADAVLRETLARLLPRPARGARRVARARRRRRPARSPPWPAQAEAAPPRHVPFDAWGRRVDAIEVSPAWTALQHEAARWGLAARRVRAGAWARSRASTTSRCSTSSGPAPRSGPATWP